MDLPLKKGVSSSAAVCVLVAKAFDRVYRLGLFPHELMELAYLGERSPAASAGGWTRRASSARRPCC